MKGQDAPPLVSSTDHQPFLVDPPPPLLIDSSTGQPPSAEGTALPPAILSAAVLHWKALQPRQGLHVVYIKGQHVDVISPVSECPDDQFELVNP